MTLHTDDYVFTDVLESNTDDYVFTDAL